MKSLYNVLVINPGSTSTKISVFIGDKEIISKNVEHDWNQLKKFKLFDQTSLRREAIIHTLKENDYDINKLDAVVSRGANLIKPAFCGIYKINDEILKDAQSAQRGHASSLGPSLAESIAREMNIEAYLIHPSNINEHSDLATFSGLKGLNRDATFHCESHKAVGRVAAERLNKNYDNVNLIVAHLGGGISICAHHYGKCIDSISANKGLGPFTGRRTGGLSPWQVMDICFKEGITKAEVEDILMKNGGLASYLGTDDCIEIEKRIADGDEYAATVYEAMAYRISSSIASLAPALYGKVDAVCLTGGMAHSTMLCKWIEERTSFIAPLMVFPGSLEQEYMNEYMQEILRGEVELNIY